MARSRQQVLSLVFGVFGILPIYAVAPVIIQQPQSQYVLYNCSATFSVRADGTPPLTFEWFIHGRRITGATGPTLSITNATLVDQGPYNVVVSNPYGSVSSSNAYLAVSLDVFPPTLTHASPGWESNTVLLVFSTMCGGLWPQSAEDVFNYSIDGLSVTSAVLQCSGKAVLLATSPQTTGEIYTIRLANIMDLTGNVSGEVERSFEAGIVPCPPDLEAAMCVREHPSNVVVSLSTRSQFRVVVQSGVGALAYQWEISTPQNWEWEVIPGADQSTLLLPPTETCAQSGTLVRCRIRIGNCEWVSHEAALTVLCDCAPLYLVRVTPLAIPDTLLVDFSESVIEDTALDIFNYEIPGLEVLEAEMVHYSRVRLRTTPQTPGQTYTLRATDISDYSDPSCGFNLIDLSRNHATFVARNIVPGVLQYEVWSNAPGWATLVLFPTESTILEQADDPGGPWIDMPGAPNPAFVPLNARARFYRLRKVPEGFTIGSRRP